MKGALSALTFLISSLVSSLAWTQDGDPKFSDLIPEKVASASWSVGTIVGQAYEDGVVVGRSFCTGFLVSSELVMTNHHCHTDSPPAKGKANQAKEIIFRHPNEPTRWEIYPVLESVLELPDEDISIVRLDEPVRIPGLFPLPVVPMKKLPKHPWIVSSYSNSDFLRDPRPGNLPSIVIQPCSVIKESGMAIAMKDCIARPGNSGSPILNHSGEVIAILNAIEFRAAEAAIQGMEYITGEIGGILGFTMRAILPWAEPEGARLRVYMETAGTYAWDRLRVGGLNYAPVGQIESLWPRPGNGRR